MHKRRIMFIFGTRPEAIKMAPVISKIGSHPDIFTSIIAVTAQHREMLDQTLKPFGIRPDYDMAIMEPNQTLTSIVSKTLHGFEEIVLHERPDIVLVQGDTSTTFAAALAAFYRQIPVGHIEAGLRTGHKYNPFPEEMNRKMTTALADIHFAPTETSLENLLKEGVPRSRIFLTGNTVIDALMTAAQMPCDLKKAGVNLKKGKKTILVTTHRRESLGMPMKNTCEAIAKIAKKYSDRVSIIIPVHKNPVVRDIVESTLGDLNEVQLIEPLDYIPFVHLMKEADIILTDSGGIQEEAPSLGKPVLVLRQVTERPEAVLANTVKVVGTDKDTIFKETERLLTDEEEYKKMAHSLNPYGDGKASDRIVLALLKYFGFTDVGPEEFDYVH
ncbi:MAG: UDP-N-acetylglucosamine 2-epimerase (non-hydrolyzing) [Candidatus Margulisiibacteriota bacterium]